ncbi:PGF-CTERM sorting domain-containing protein [Halococcoides cellulosivorans]|uniref:PGF-CTERM sorting domain-containing protein n=1 Tax=Halococcoides cellulosivorans TaxID=1679096 RepID=A0A2R4X258_9EURY|nr:PGF-CTERM sorting domain-containing protein [Halococcoides cellulosivorans]AWB27882.1 hypothetical protein HARCEL1_09225 [Halococcoides cellulosivorans]
MKRTAIGVVAVAVVVALASPAVVGAADGPVLNGTMSGEDTVVVAIETVPDGGISGFDLTVEATGDASFESAAAGSDFLVSNAKVADDGRSVSVKAADSAEQISGGETDLELATIQLSGTADRPPVDITDVEIQANDGTEYDVTIRVEGADDSSSGGGADPTATDTDDTPTATSTTAETTTESTSTETTAATDETTESVDAETTAVESTTASEDDPATTEADADDVTTAETTDGGGAPATTGSGPGFGVALALAALAAIGLFARVRPY